MFCGYQPCIQPPLRIRWQTRFLVCSDFFFLEAYLPKKILFHVEALNGHQESPSCTGSPLLFFPPDKFRAQCCTLSPLLSLDLLLLLFPLHSAHTRTPPLWHASLLGALVAWQSSILQAATWLQRRWGRGWANVFQHFFLCIYHRAVAFLKPGLLLLQLPVQTPDGAQQQEPSVHS